MSNRFDVVVVGSANYDSVFAVPVLPRTGETVAAEHMFTNLGGKGLNQAVAAARCRALTAFIGAVGDDAAGASVLEALKQEAIHASVRREGTTGAAFVFVDRRSENFIVTVAGANDRLENLSPDEQAIVKSSRVVLVQNEIPMAARLQVLLAARNAGSTTILNAAPSVELPAALLELVDVLIVNLGEAEMLISALGLTSIGRTPHSPVEEARAAAQALLAVVPMAVVTLGSDGAIVHQENSTAFHVEAFPAAAIDTTAAGDTWSGSFAALLAHGHSVSDAARFASAAASLAVQHSGALASIPHEADVVSVLKTAGREYFDPRGGA